MGADLLLMGLTHRTNKKLNWPAGRKVIRKMDPDTLQRRLEEEIGSWDDGVVEARSQANTILTELKAELKNGGRDAYTWKIGKGATERTLHIRGGTSWGDDPSAGWTVFANAAIFPEALAAIGFEIN